jgi:hypothetical protein
MTRLLRTLAACLLAAGAVAVTAAPARTQRTPPVRAFLGGASFTPGGHYLAFRATDDWKRETFVDLQGRPAFVGAPFASGGLFSPDDSRIATVDASPTTHVWDVATGTEIASLPGYTPGSWSADGSTLVLTGGPTLVAFATDDFRAPQPAATGLAPDPSCCREVIVPTLSPNRQWLAYLSTTWSEGDRNVPSGVVVQPLAGGVTTSGYPTCAIGGESYAWSADSAWIAYDSDDCEETAPPELALLPVRRGLREPHDERTAAAGPNLDTPVPWAWAPRGHTIAFVSGRRLVLQDAATAESVFVPAAFHFAWSPDGKRLVVVQRGLVRIVSAAGKLLRTIGPGSDVSWSTGDLVAYTRRGCGPAMGVHLVRPDGSRDRRLPGAVCVVQARSAGLVTGTPWNDEVRAQDGRRQTIRCGKGRDTAYVDAQDRVAGDCERRVVASG